jgi:hypothetical protein
VITTWVCTAGGKGVPRAIAVWIASAVATGTVGTGGPGNTTVPSGVGDAAPGRPGGPDGSGVAVGGASGASGASLAVGPGVGVPLGVVEGPTPGPLGVTVIVGLGVIDAVVRVVRRRPPA